MPPQPQRNPMIDLTLDMGSINKLLDILGDKPFKEVADLIVDIRNQATAQLQPMQGMPRPNGEAPEPPPN